MECINVCRSSHTLVCCVFFEVLPHIAALTKLTGGTLNIQLGLFVIQLKFISIQG